MIKELPNQEYWDRMVAAGIFRYERAEVEAALLEIESLQAEVDAAITEANVVYQRVVDFELSKESPQGQWFAHYFFPNCAANLQQLSMPGDYGIDYAHNYNVATWRRKMVTVRARLRRLQAETRTMVAHIEGLHAQAA